MAKWVDISAHRVRMLTHSELLNDYDTVGVDGEVGTPGPVLLYRRLSDGKVFKMSPWQLFGAFDAAMVALVEV